MRKSIVIGLHLGYWFLYSFLFTFLFVMSRATAQSAFDDWDDWIAILVLASLTGLTSFYTFYWWLVPRYLTTRRVKRFIGLGVLVSLTVALLMTVLLSLATTVILYVTLHQTQFILFQPDDQLLLIVGFGLLALVNGILSTIIRGFITWYTDIHVKETLITKNLQTELALLKARINPHFLFNTLNNIDVLIEHDTSAASLYLNKLSDLLRFVLYETQADQIPLTNELASIHQYIDLQRIRTTNNQYVSLQIDGAEEAARLTIAPMTFVSYIENAFKYATNKKVNDAIRIRISIEGNEVHFCCVNRIDSATAVRLPHTGLGNELLKQRLALLYGDNHTLNVRATESEYHVDLRLRLKTYELSAG